MEVRDFRSAFRGPAAPVPPPPPAVSREISLRNLHPVGDPRHAAAGAEILETFLRGTDLEGFGGDRALLGRACAWLSEPGRGGAPSVAECYRLRSADRVETTFVHGDANPRAIPGLPGRYEVGLTCAIEVTRRDDLAFRTSPCWRRMGGRGWIVVDPGDGPPVPRVAGRDVLLEAQDASLEAGLRAEAAALASIAVWGPQCVDVAAALKATSLPRSVRDRAAAPLAAAATLADVIVSLAEVASACDREEGESYARAAGRLVARASSIVAATCPSAVGGAGGA